MVQICTFLSSTNFGYLFIPTGQLEILFCAYIWPILFRVPCLCLVDLWEFVYVVAINIILNMHCKYLLPAVAYLFFSLNHVFDEWAFLILMNLNLSIFLYGYYFVFSSLKFMKIFYNVFFQKLCWFILEFCVYVSYLFPIYCEGKVTGWENIPHFKTLSFPLSIQILLTIFSNASIYFSFFSTIFSCPSYEYETWIL